MPWEDAVAYAAFIQTWQTAPSHGAQRPSLGLSKRERGQNITSRPEAHAALVIAVGMYKKLPNLQHLSIHEQRVYKQVHAQNNAGPDAPPYDSAQDA